MRPLKRALALLLVLVLASGCDLAAIDSGGGGGDDQNLNFSQGYAFARDREIFVADKADYQTTKKLTSSGGNSEPFLSGDGRTVVFVHTDDATGAVSLKKVPVSGGSESELVAAQADRKVSQPALTSDGSTVVFISSSKGSAALTTIAISGGGEQAVPQSAKDASPTFYPDGKRILAFTGPDSLTRNELVSVDVLSGTRTSRLAGIADAGARAALSPDGANIAYEAKVSGRTHIFVVPESGGTPKQVSNTDGNDTFPTWVSAGRIGFTSSSGGQDNVYEVDVAGGSAKLTVPVASQASFGGK